ncbi:hypothetical protein ACFQFQ_31285 [Sulfitobacter porphyrae]|uniref:Uncharacterized protein n=1 Tax=Sulfitobacter porphyrae TaxID=1246864 RepID=A0ABW2BBH2_9RHOB
MSFWRKHGDRFLDGLITYVFRIPSWPSRLLRAGVTLIVAGLGVGGLVGDLSWIDADRVLRLAVQADGGGLSVYWSQITVFLGILLLAAGGPWCDRSHRRPAAAQEAERGCVGAPRAAPDR